MYCGYFGLYFRVSRCILSTTLILLVSLRQASITHASHATPPVLLLI